MRRATIAAAASVLLAFVPVARSQSLEERLAALEQRVKALEEENSALKKEVAAKPGAPAVAKAMGKESEIKVGGFTQVQAEVGDRGDTRFTDDNDRLYLRRIRLGVSGKFLEDFEWKTELEAAGSVGSATAIRAQLVDAYLGWRRTEKFGVRGGQFKTPFGQEHLFSDTKLAFVERTFGSDRLTLGRQAGLMLDGSAAEKRFNWAVSAFNGPAQNTSGNDDDRWVFISRLNGVPAQWKFRKRDASWSLGVNGYTSTDGSIAMPGDFKFDLNTTTPGNDNIFRGRRSGFGADTQLVVGPVEFWAEWLSTSFRPDNDLPVSSFDARSRTAQVAFLTKGGHLQTALRWDDFDPNQSVVNDETDTWSAGLAWLIRGHDLKLQGTYMWVDGPSPVDVDKKLLLRFQVLF